MTIFLLIGLPLAAAALSWAIPGNERRPLVLPAAGAAHAALAFLAVAAPQGAGPWFSLDPLGKIVLITVSVLFLCCSAYAVSYLSCRRERSNRVLCTGLLVALAAMSAAAAARHLGVLWLAMETTTLGMAPLIYFNRNARSLEATWKYMLICSVGIALALLGLFFLAYSTIVAGLPPTLITAELAAAAPRLSPVWLDTAFIFLLVGFGTKAGLVPLHTWKPDAYGEAPGLVGALLAGGLTTTSILGILRISQICSASGHSGFHRDILTGMGLFSIAVAAAFLLRQSDFKRMLAYSSVEHVGIMAVAVGLGGQALFAGLLHLIGNGLGKGAMFLSAGNIHRAYGTKNAEQVRGLFATHPGTGIIFFCSFLLSTGSPPFSTFVSEFLTAAGFFSAGRIPEGILFLTLLGLAFAGMARTVVPMLQGEGGVHLQEGKPYRHPFLMTAPPFCLLGLVLFLGMWLPAPLRDLLADGARLLEGRP